MRTVSLAVLLAASLMAQNLASSTSSDLIAIDMDELAPSNNWHRERQFNPFGPLRFTRPSPSRTMIGADSRLYNVSLGVLSVGHVADIASSSGGFEANPLLRRPDGRFSLSRGVWLKAATSGTSVVVQQILRRKQPREWHKYGKLFTVLNIGIGATAGVIAVRNWRMR
jgi:hypothetical protein